MYDRTSINYARLYTGQSQNFEQKLETAQTTTRIGVKTPAITDMPTSHINVSLLLYKPLHTPDNAFLRVYSLSLVTVLPVKGTVTQEVQEQLSARLRSVRERCLGRLPSIFELRKDPVGKIVNFVILKSKLQRVCTLLVVQELPIVTDQNTSHSPPPSRRMMTRTRVKTEWREGSVPIPW